MAINIGPIITNAHAAQNLTHMAIIRNIRQAGRCGPDSDGTVDDTKELISGQGEVNPLRVIVFALLSLIIGVVLLVYLSWAGDRIANLPQVYKPQVELSKREYYPAYLVNKYHNEACNSKTGTCTSRYIFVVKLENGKYKEVNMTKDSYLAHTPGSDVHLERHITDPAQHKLLESQNQKYNIVYATMFGYLFFAFGVLYSAFLVIRYYVLAVV